MSALGLAAVAAHLSQKGPQRSRPQRVAPELSSPGADSWGWLGPIWEEAVFPVRLLPPSLFFCFPQQQAQLWTDSEPLELGFLLGAGALQAERVPSQAWMLTQLVAATYQPAFVVSVDCGLQDSASGTQWYWGWGVGRLRRV